MCAMAQLTRTDLRSGFLAEPDRYAVAVAYSTPKLPLIPRQSCHSFHTKAATDSMTSLPPIPRQSCR